MPPQQRNSSIHARSIISVGAENLCHQAIFVNPAPGAIAPLDADLIQIRGEQIKGPAKFL